MSEVKLRRVDITLTLDRSLDSWVERKMQTLPSYSATKRKDRKASLTNAFKVVVANLCRSAQFDEEMWTEIPRGNKDYPAGLQNPNEINTRAITAVLDDLEFTSDLGFIERRGGNHNPDTGQGYYSRYRLKLMGKIVLYMGLLMEASSALNRTREIGEDVEGDKVTKVALASSEKTNQQSLRLTRNTLSTSPFSPINTHVFEKKQGALLRLKGSKADGKNPMPVPVSDETKRMESDLKTINSAIEDYWIDIVISDDQLQLLLSSRADIDEYGFRSNVRRSADLLFGKSLYRVFNNGRMNHGGRFYGGWWMSIPSRLRKYITINWYPTVELDFSGLQISMLYAREGHELPDDPYSLEGFPTSHRGLLKKALLKVINAEGKMRAPRKDSLPEGWSWTDVLHALRAKHEAIARYFNTGVGIELQRIDADIANAVMLRMLRESKLALPVHDSFIVVEGHEELLSSVMHEEYERRLGHPISVSEDDRLLPLPTEAELQAYREGEISLEDERIVQLSEGAEYNGYRERKTSALREWGEEWGHRHSFHF